MLFWKEIRIEKGSKEAQRVPWDSLFCLKPLSPSTGGALGMLQLSCAVTVSGGCSALTFTIPQAHPCSMAHGGTSPFPLPLPG